MIMTKNSKVLLGNEDEKTKTQQVSASTIR